MGADLAQVAATLAATLVAYHTVNADGQRLLDERMLNAVLVLMLVTSILGPVLTERFAPRMLDAESREKRTNRESAFETLTLCAPPRLVAVRGSISCESSLSVLRPACLELGR